MASLKISLTNYIETATLKNGTGGGAPARDEVSPYVMEKVQARSRRQFWQKSAASDLDVDFLLAASTALDAGGIAGHLPISGVGISQYTMKYQTGAYTPGGTWTTIPGMSAIAVSSALDKVRSFDSQVTADSIRFSLTVSSVFTLALCVAGKHDHDLGTLWSSLSAEKITPQFEDQSFGGDSIINYVGTDREHWNITWNDILGATLAKLEATRATRRSFWIMDKLGVGREFIAVGGRLARTHHMEYASDTLYRGVSMSLKQVV